MVKLILTVNTPQKEEKKTLFKNHRMMCVDCHETVKKKAVNVTLLQSNLYFGFNIQMSLIWEETQTDVLLLLNAAWLMLCSSFEL